VLAEGKADFIAMGRKLLADPDLPNKLAEGRLDDIRPCLYQYRCIGNIFVREPLRCIANASTGREDDHDQLLVPTSRRRHMLVVGGGAGGLEAARLLAGRGHRVTVWEGGERLGGLLALAARADPLMDRYLGWLRRQVEQAEVAIELGQRADSAAVLALGADEVVLATGARWERPQIPGAELAHVMTVPELRRWLDGDDDTVVGTAVAILGGGKIGLSLAELCQRRGRTVTVIEPSPVFGIELGLPGRWRIVADLEASGAVLMGSTAAAAITPDGVHTSAAGPDAGNPAEGNRGVAEVKADTVIIASGAVPDSGLAGELSATALPIHLVGNCRTVANIEGANLDAARTAILAG